MRAKSSRFHRLGEILEGSPPRPGVEQALRQHKIAKVWPQVVGEAVASVSQVSGVKGKTLFVNVRDPVWMQELHFLQDRVLSNLHGIPEGKEISKVYFRLGEIGATAPAVRRVRPRSPLTEEEMQEINQLSGQIPDPEGADLVRSLLAKGYRSGRRGRT